MASEVGVLDVPPEHVVHKGRLQPGRMFLVDTEQGRIVADEEIKAQIVNEQPYASGSKQHLVHLQGSAGRARAAGAGSATVLASASRRSATRSRTCACSWRRWRATASKPSAPWAPTRRWPCSRTSRAALRLLQAALRAGHEPADRLHPRRDHHVVGHDARLRAQPARSAPGELPPSSSSKARSSPTRSSPSCGACRCPASSRSRCRILFRAERGEDGLEQGDGGDCAPRRDRRSRRTRSTSSSSPTAA